MQRAKPARAAARNACTLIFMLLAARCASAQTTWPCGGEGERPCSATEEIHFFWTNGNFFCDRGLKATGFRILPDIGIHTSELLAGLTEETVREALVLLKVRIPALRERLQSLGAGDFLSDVCLGISSGGGCWTTPPIPGTAGTPIRKCFADPSGAVPGITEDGECWIVPPSATFEIPRIAGFCPGIESGGKCYSIIPGPPKKGHWIFRCYADPAGIIPGIEQGGSCWATPPIPGVPAATVPLPDFTKPGWTVAEDIASLISDVALILESMGPGLATIPGNIPSLGFDRADFPSDAELFDPQKFQSELALMKVFLDLAFFRRYSDLILDLTSPPGRCVNDTRRQPEVDALASRWESRALSDQRRIGLDEPINWVQHIYTHNAFNTTADGFPFPNHWYSLTDQLRIGVRALELDPHWFNFQLRLCHGKGDDGCFLFDRFFSNGIKEIGRWLEENPGEFIILEIDDDGQKKGRDDYYNDPIQAYLGDLVFRPADREGGSAGRWPTLRELAELRKQVILMGGQTHGDRWIHLKTDELSPATFFHHDDTYRYSGRWEDGAFKIEFIPAHLTAFYRVYEARSAFDPFKWAGILDEEAYGEAVKCYVNFVGFDQIAAKEKTPLSVCEGARINEGPEAQATCATPDDRLAHAVWSWRRGVVPAPGTTALWHGSDGRWTAEDPTQQHVFACAKARPAPEVGGALGWDDPEGEEWQITAGSGTWQSGCSKCSEEFGAQGFVFAAPVNGWQNRRLLEAAELYVDRHGLPEVDVWLNHDPNPGVVGIADCNRSGSADACDIASGFSEDCNGNGIPDECEVDHFPTVGDVTAVPGFVLEGCYADAEGSRPGTVEEEECWAVPPSQVSGTVMICPPEGDCFCLPSTVRFGDLCFPDPPGPPRKGVWIRKCYADAGGTQPGGWAADICYAVPPSKTLPEPSSTFAGPPDGLSGPIGLRFVTFDFGDRRVVDRAGPDFNVYEVELSEPEFQFIDVLVSADGLDFVSIKDSEGPVVRIPGDEAHRRNEFARSYNLAGSRLNAVRYIRVQGLGSRFELDAVGAIHVEGRLAECSQTSLRFVRGDANSDGTSDISDAVQILGYLFLGSPQSLVCPRSADTDASRELDLNDGVYLLAYLFLGGPAPQAPFPDCGRDARRSDIPCPSFPRCR